MIKLDTTIPLDLEKFWCWWITELGLLIPNPLRNLISRKQNFFVLSKNGGGIELTHVTDHSSRNLGRFALNEEGRQSIERLVSEQSQSTDTDIVLRLSPEQGLRKVFMLPAAVQENLGKVVAFEMDRQTPFTSDQVYYDARVVEKLPDSKQIKIELALVLRSQLDEILQELFDWGLRPTIVDLAQTDGREELSNPTYNLLPLTLRSKKRDLPRTLNITLSVILLLVFVVILIIPVWSNKTYLAELQQEIAKVGKIAGEVRSLKKEADDQLLELDFLLEKKGSEPVMVELLEELTKLIPDKSWLTYLQYKNRRLQIQGQSPSASVLIETIESSAMFQNTSFVSPVTQDRKTNFERFQIATDVINRRLSEQTADSKS